MSHKASDESYPPTDEQAAIVDASTTGEDLVVEAGAGTGKTSTLKLLAQAAPRRRGLYLAYNRAIKEDAARSFPASVECRTSHGLAYGPTRYKHRLGGRRVPARIAAQVLGINEPVRLAADLAPLAPQQLARLAVHTVDRFCHSADDEVTARHVPLVNGLEDHTVRAELARAVVPFARRAWSDLTATGGSLYFTHDVYLKIYQLSRPRLSFDYLLVDEAQDLNPVVQAIVDYQTGAQTILVGDRCQAIYGWRGAVDAMAHATGRRLYLSQSFRFGPAIAVEANKWLGLLGSRLRLRGYDRIPSAVGPVADPDAILCRSNAGALARVMDATAAGRRTALVGGGGDLRSLAQAAEELQRTGSTQHPELLAFTSWRQVQEYCEQDQSGSDLKVLVTLIDRHGIDTIVRTVDRLVDERDAQLVVSTAHKAKGREWPTVKIASDFREPRPDPDTGVRSVILPRDEAMLAYVAVTRAMRHLDRDGLAWVDQWVPGVPARSIDRLIDASSLGAPHAVELRRRAREDLTGELTGMPEEQADWDEDDAVEASLREIAARDVPPAVVEAAAAIEAPEPSAPDDGLSPDCQRCGHHYTACRCRLMPDRRRLAPAPS